jgi:hypothetical protein
MHKELEKREGRLRFVTHLKRRVLECCVADFGQHNPLNLIRSCKNQQVMLAEKATHNNIAEEKFMFLGQKFFT